MKLVGLWLRNIWVMESMNSGMEPLPSFRN